MSIKEPSLRLLQPLRRLLGFGAVSLILFVATVGSAQPDNFPLRADGIAPLANATPQQAADIQSIINVHTAYANNLDSHNVAGVASLMLLTNGYTLQKDTPTMEPAGCAPQPQPDTPCIAQGGCFALGASSTQLFLPGLGTYAPPVNPTPARGRHNLGDYNVTFADNGRSALLYDYWNTGRYILDFWKTQAGWKIKWHRVVWTARDTLPCLVDWSQKINLLGTDLYLMQLVTAGPQLPVAIVNNPSIKRVNKYLDLTLEQVNLGAYAKVCALVSEMAKVVRGDAALDAEHKEYFGALSYRFLQDGACDGRVPPDRTHSNGGWAAAAVWRAYAMSGAPVVPKPKQVPTWSVELIQSNS